MASLPQASAQNLNWFSRKGYLQGVFFIILVALTSNLNDILMRFSGRLPSIEITFFRYFFASLSLLVLTAVKKDIDFRTTRIGLHVVRAALLCVAIVCWSKAVTMVPLAVMSTLALTVPLFVLPLAYIFLKDPVGLPRTLATVFGFLGILIIVAGRSDTGLSQEDIVAVSSDYGLFATLKQLLVNSQNMFLDADNGVLILILASICFAASDVINKKYVTQESTVSMMFYIAVFTAAFAAVLMTFSQTSWVAPNLTELLALIVLGIGGNLILYFLLKAFAATDVSALAPYRYTELIFAAFFGYILFGETLNKHTYAGTVIIVLATAWISYVELRGKKKAK